MKKIISLFTLVVITNLPISCGLGCGPFDNRPYKIVSISSEIGTVTDNIFNQTNSSDFRAAAIRATVDETTRVGQNGEINFSFLNIAYACSPPEPGFQRLTSIKIFSDESIFFNGVEYQGGDNLQSLFKILDFDTGINVAGFNDSPSSFHFFVGFEGEEILFQLLSKPDESISQKITFTFTFDDGLEYQSLTPLFTVD